MANSSYLTEIKKEYTIQLVNMLTPAIYEGINSIYLEVKKISKEGEELKLFQKFLAQIPSWTEPMIVAEASRIKTVIPNSDILDDLIKAVIQSNIILLTNTDVNEKQKLLNEFNIDLNYNKFIHNVYIEVAKTFYNYPFLFFHKMGAYDYKRNQLKAHELIKETIEEAIRKMLPLKMILKKYLGIVSETNDNKHIKPLINTESNNNQYNLVKNEQAQQQIGGNVVQSPPPMSLKEIYEQQKRASLSSPSVKPIPLTERTGQQGGNQHGPSAPRVPTIIIPAEQNTAVTNQMVPPHRNNSETSQPYHKQDGHVEEEFSNMAKKKAELDTISENSNDSKSNKNIFNFRNY